MKANFFIAFLLYKFFLFIQRWSLLSRFRTSTSSVSRTRRRWPVCFARVAQRRCDRALCSRASLCEPCAIQALRFVLLVVIILTVWKKKFWLKKIIKKARKIFFSPLQKFLFIKAFTDWLIDIEWLTDCFVDYFRMRIVLLSFVPPAILIKGFTETPCPAKVTIQLIGVNLSTLILILG